MYYLKNGIYYPASVRYTEEGTIIIRNRKFTLAETGNEGNVLETKNAELNSRLNYSASFTLYTFANANLSGTYATINREGSGIDSQAVIRPIPADRTFYQRDDFLRCAWTVSGNTITNLADGIVYTMTPSVDLSGTPVMLYDVGGVTFNLYPVAITANGSNYDVLTFTYQDNVNYQRQFITAK